MIEQLLDLTNYATDTRVARRKGSGGSQEFFTPYSIVKRMADKISDSDWADPTKTFLESSFGSGQFVVYIVWNRIQHGIDWETALKTLYGVELQLDNVIECHDSQVGVAVERPAFVGRHELPCRENKHGSHDSGEKSLDVGQAARGLAPSAPPLICRILFLLSHFRKVFCATKLAKNGEIATAGRQIKR